MKTNKTIKRLISTLAITALVLTAPFFAFAEDGNGENAEPEVSPSATYKDSRVPGTSGGAVILMNAENGDIIYEKNSHQLREPASTTKVLTCLTALEVLDMDEILTAPDNVESAGTSLDLEPGEEMTAEQLFYGMMLISGNDAAQVLGLAAGDGDMKTFCEMMNNRAKECGAEDTNFKNPNGLNENAKTLNVTTVYDQAMITRQALKNEKFRTIVSTVKYTIPKTNKSKKRKLVNGNKCLWNDKRTVQIGDKNIPLKYTGCTGVKTGYTSSAGGCYIGSAKRDGMELIVVSYGSPDSAGAFADAIRLWDYGFKYYKTHTAMTEGEALTKLKVKKGALAKVRVGLDEDLDITLDKDDENADQITTKTKIFEKKPMAPIEKGAVMGTVKAYDKDGNLIAVRDLKALEEVEEGGPLSNIGIADEYAWIFILALVIAILIAAFLYYRWRKEHPRQRKPKAPKPEKPKKPKAKAPAMIKKQRKPKPKKPAKPKTRRPAAPEPDTEVEAASPVREYYYKPPAGREIAPPLAQEMAQYRESLQRDNEAYRQQMEQENARRREEISQRVESFYYDDRYDAGESQQYAPRGERTKAEKRAIRKERAKRRKERQR